MSENKKKKAADNLPAASGQPDAQAGGKESLFKDGEQFIVIPFNRLPRAFSAELETGSNADSQEEQL
jgi:hypothetical protein